MAKQQFGGDWTDLKLEKIRGYLHAYMSIMSKRNFTTGYIDAFAGTGYRSIKEACPDDALLFDELDAPEMDGYRSGSARIALETEPPFSRYVFIEKSRSKCAELDKLKSSFPALSDRIAIHNRESNEYISEMCDPKKNWQSHRAVMFLDPFGMQVSWDTIEKIAATKAIDLWYLFPIGAVNRLLERDGCLQKGFAESLDRVLGTKEWSERFYQKTKETSLFGETEKLSKDSDFEKIGNYIKERLSTVFAGVAKESYILRNSKQSPLFMLCFAVGNPNAKDTALKIAEHLLKD